MKVLVKVASAQSLDDPAVLDPLVSTESWQTIITFARESARTFPLIRSLLFCSVPLTRFFPERKQPPRDLHKPPLQVLPPISWTKTSLQNCTNNSEVRKVRVALGELGVVQDQGLVVLGEVEEGRGCVRIVRLRTRMGGRIARFVGCRCEV